MTPRPPSWVALPLHDDDGVVRGHLRVATIKATTAEALGQPPLRDLRDAPDDDPLEPGLEPVQLVEAGRYRYEVTGLAVDRLDPSELFEPDDDTNRTGRLVPGQATGRLPIIVHGPDCVARTAVEVRSVKLDYLTDYRRMLDDVARLGSEMVLMRFAATEQRLEVAPDRDPETLYHRFALLRSLILSDRLVTAIRLVTTQPYHELRTAARAAPPGRPVHGSGTLARRLGGPGARVAWDDSPLDTLATFPRALVDDRKEERFDNLPNRFVRFALEQFRALAEDLLVELAAAAPIDRRPHPIARGLREAAAMRDQLDDALRSPVLAEAGRLDTFPASSQVLQKRPGYREIFEAFTLHEAGSLLSWAGGADVFGAGQRNVAALYEVWVFIELARILARLAGSDAPLQALFEVAATKVGLKLRQGTELRIPCRLERRGRVFDLELTYNREFAPGEPATRGSWTRRMRPDVSLRIAPHGAIAPLLDDLWLHFDAKYRVEVPPLDDPSEEPRLGPKDIDLLKMHTYRDAIVRAAGAYVIYPGHAKKRLEEHHELLPSLGAFPLRPSGGEAGEGSEAIARFIDEVLDHLAAQTTQHERARFWHSRAFSDPPAESTVETTVTAVPFLERPAADTVVLLGYLRGAEHAAWVATRHLYNLRAEPGRAGALDPGHRALDARLLVTYRVDAPPAVYRVVPPTRVMTRDALVAGGHPGPGGEVYFVLALDPLPLPAWLARADVMAVARRLAPPALPPGAPIATTWAAHIATAREQSDADTSA